MLGLCKEMLSLDARIIKGGGSEEKYVGVIGRGAVDEHQEVHNDGDDQISSGANNVQVRFAIRCLHFMDCYRKGLNGQQAAWVAKSIVAIGSFQKTFSRR